MKGGDGEGLGKGMKRSDRAKRIKNQGRTTARNKRKRIVITTKHQKTRVKEQTVEET